MDITQHFISERDRALLGGDYDTYHSRTVRRLHALRRRLGIATPKGRKFTPKSPVTAENVAQNPLWVQLLLANSERAWAHAMAMKSAQSPENTQKPIPGSTKKQIVSRYRRAILHATNLVEVVEETPASSSNSIDLLEAKAYLALLTGGLYFEKAQWEACIRNYAIARLVYSSLAPTSKTDIFKELLSTTVDPSIRYAAYQLKLSRTQLVSDIAIEKFPSSEPKVREEVKKLQPDAFKISADKAAAQSDQPTLPSTIVWRSRKVNIEDATVSQAIGVAQEKEAVFEKNLGYFNNAQPSSKELALSFDEVINARQDVADGIKNAIDELRGQGIDQGDMRIQSLQVARTAINYAVIEWQIGRNRVLCGADDGLSFEPKESKQHVKPKDQGKPRIEKEESSGKKLSRLRERLVLYDSTLQSIEAVKELPGVIADTDFLEILEGKRAYFHALKCLAIGRSHAVNGAVLNALALYSRAHEAAQKSLAQIKPSETNSDIPYKIEISTSQLRDLNSVTNGISLQYQALADLSQLNKTIASQEGAQAPPFIERLHHKQFDDNVDLKNLVNYPPKLQPIPVKPLFFDLAWNYIQYPGREVDLDVAATTTNTKTVNEGKSEPKSTPAKKGWFGFGR